MTSQGSIAIRGDREEDIDDLIAIFTRAVRETARRDYTPEQVRAWAAGLKQPGDAAQRQRKRKGGIG
ncbi:MAG: hypothetical protein JNK84_12875 [Phreatobacter sp.]|uniref:hypothetical protein n=1 Tax=Phreatobacter sp. TaxID=1966341 RepID=UPI001A447CCF|nr:hypothetical protein [Phreatobacter sp.]MBL8569958.1 hypothetical protein [Phreatobacter sp.]